MAKKVLVKKSAVQKKKPSDVLEHKESIIEDTIKRRVKNIVFYRELNGIHRELKDQINLEFSRNKYRMTQSNIELVNLQLASSKVILDHYNKLLAKKNQEEKKERERKKQEKVREKGFLERIENIFVDYIDEEIIKLNSLEAPDSTI